MCAFGTFVTHKSTIKKLNENPKGRLIAAPSTVCTYSYVYLIERYHLSNPKNCLHKSRQKPRHFQHDNLHCTTPLLKIVCFILNLVYYLFFFREKHEKQPSTSMMNASTPAISCKGNNSAIMMPSDNAHKHQPVCFM